MFLVKRRVATLSALAIALFTSLIAASPASANRIDNPQLGIDVNQGSPNYDVTIHCNDLPYAVEELFTGATQHGTYSLHADTACQDNNSFVMEVNDNGDTSETGGYTISGVHTVANGGWINIPAAMTLDPDTYVTIKRLVNGVDYFNIRYNGSDSVQIPPVVEPPVATLSHTGSDSETLALFAVGFVALGLTFTGVSRRKKVAKKH